MFGVGTYNSYGFYVIDFLGGVNVGVITTLAIRLLVGLGWYKLFEKVGEKGWKAFVPIYGEYTAWRIINDDFSWAAIFATATFGSWVAAVGIDHPIMNGCAWVALIMWWVFALMTAHCFQTSMFFGFIYGSIPWLGALIYGFSGYPAYKGPVSLEPPKTKKEREAEKKARRKEQKQTSKK